MKSARHTRGTSHRPSQMRASGLGLEGAVPQNRWDLVPPPREAPVVSVVVPFADQQAQLERLLVGLELSEGPSSIVEVVVADDGSTVAPVVPPWYAGPPVTVVRQPDLGRRPAAVRNLGVEATTGDVLVFLDGDMVPSPTYVDAVARLPAVAPDALVVGTRHHWDLDGWGPDATRAWLTGSGAPPPRLPDPEWLAAGYEGSDHLVVLDPRSYQLVIGAVMTMARPLFEELGGFDETIVGYGGEDWDLAHRWQKAGGLLAHVDAVAHHDGPDWRLREGPDATKNPERVALVERIPGRHDAVVGPWASIVVTLDVEGWSVDEILTGVGDLLAAGGTAIAVAVVGAAAPVPTVLAHDSRVHWGGLARPLEERADVVVHASVPVRCGERTLGAITDVLRPGGPGRLRILDPDGELLRAEEVRARHRVARWSTGAGDPSTWAALFGDEAELSAELLGAQRLRRGLDLAEVFPR
jgi:hypothetical protein